MSHNFFSKLRPDLLSARSLVISQFSRPIRMLLRRSLFCPQLIDRVNEGKQPVSRRQPFMCHFKDDVNRGKVFSVAHSAIKTLNKQRMATDGLSGKWEVYREMAILYRYVPRSCLTKQLNHPTSYTSNNGY